MGYDFQTSLPAYKEPGKDSCRQKVFFAIKTLGECTDRMIAKHLDWPINRVTPRRGELTHAGIVEGAGVKKDQDGKRNVNWWKISPVTPKQGQLWPTGEIGIAHNKIA